MEQEQTDAWYDSTQGSRLVPLTWFRALEQSSSSDLFLSDANFQRFGIELRTLKNSTTRLARGFTVDRTDADGLPRTNLLLWK